MSEPRDSIWEFLIPLFAGMVVGAFLMGHLASFGMRQFRDEAISRGYMEYNAKTGDLNWKEPPAETVK